MTLNPQLKAQGTGYKAQGTGHRAQGTELRAQGTKPLISRDVFLKRVVRIGLLALLSIILLALGGKIATGKNCSGCPGNGICHGEADCNKY